MRNELTTLPNPFRGRKGFWNKVNRVVFTFMGPAQVGIGRPEKAFVPAADPACPVCSRPLADHDIRRGDATTPTRLNCPE